MPEDKSIHEVAPPVRPVGEGKAIGESLAQALMAAGGVGGLLGGVAATAGTVHHWNDNRPPKDPPPPPAPHIELPPGVSGDE